MRLWTSFRDKSFHPSLVRSQPHYTESDRQLMQKCWGEDAWPILREKLKQKHVAIRSDGAGPEQAPAQTQPKIHAFFEKSE